MPTAGTWKVPFRGKFGAYDANLRVVPPFSVQSLQKATVVQPPPRCHSAKTRSSKTKTTFKRQVNCKCYSFLYTSSYRKTLDHELYIFIVYISNTEPINVAIFLLFFLTPAEDVS